ncbi:TetR/AcrR family transcriptional regulator [Faecalispora anaeroviscerum]|uniref:TetR/AcrR family transcriptional regulator n=1 Tax=Faecalispora anaeroviscerum TaxID=2991836 RepID=UPI0024BAEA07|nr:TetR/AcrR family transcriptional regulator [Faecalispora anaeroviscerum]
MARKPVLEGGKRDEILDVAIQLFLENGYEGTSVRMILNHVGGEIGMFYHYFGSKQELFDKALEHFMKQQEITISHMLTTSQNGTSHSKRINQLMDCYVHSMEKFQKLSGGAVHWSILYALHDLTVEAMLPAVKLSISSLYKDLGIAVELSDVEWLAPYVLKGVSGLLHDKQFSMLPQKQQQTIIINLICRTLKISTSIFES